MTALKKQEYRNKIIPDKESEYGLPDHVYNFVAGGATAGNSRNRKSNGVHSNNSSKAMSVDNSVVKNNHPEIVGKRARRKFVDGQGEDKWYEGVVSSYNVITGKYGVYFP
jgi:hypothetical protein